MSGFTSHTYAELHVSYIGQGWTRSWDPDALVPYLRRDAGPGLISYDDAESMIAKADWGVNQAIGGFMIWELSQDFLPATGEHPLQEALGSLLCSDVETNCEDGDDDDGDTLIDCDDPDCDARMVCCLLHPDRDCDEDGRDNASDCAPDDPEAWDVPLLPGPLRVEKPPADPGTADVAWPDLSGAGPGTVYDLASGRIPDLGASFPDALCLSDNGAAPSYSDARTPGGAATDGFWYLVRAQNACGDDPFGRPALEGDSVCD